MQKKTLVKDVAKYIEAEIAPLKYSLPDDKNGLEFGSLNNEVIGITVCWSPTLKVIEKAIASKANLIVSHEWLIYEYTKNRWMENECRTSTKVPNLKRLRLLSENDMAVLRYHSSWDIAPGGIADSLGEYLGFKNLVKKGRLVRVYHEKPILLRDLADLVAEKLEISYVKVSGEPEKKIDYIGTAPGGLGQIFTYADDFRNSNAQVLIFGEMLQYTEIYTQETGYSYIATSHEASEMPGMLKMTSLLKKKFRQIPVDYLTSTGDTPKKLASESFL